MPSDPLVLSTLRKLMRPRATLRADFSVLHDHGRQTSSLTLEVVQTANETLSVIELGSDGEFVAARTLNGRETSNMMDEHSLGRAMVALWADGEDTMAEHVIAINANCVLTDAHRATPASHILAWNYLQQVDTAMIEVWVGEGIKHARQIERPDTISLRAMILGLQHQASQLLRDAISAEQQVLTPKLASAR
jgi:hypothetical protein